MQGAAGDPAFVDLPQGEADHGLLGTGEDLPADFLGVVLETAQSVGVTQAGGDGPVFLPDVRFECGQFVFGDVVVVQQA